MNSTTFNRLTVEVLTVLAVMSLTAQAASVKFQAESGTLGVNFVTGNDGGTQYINNTNNNAGNNPGSTTRVATYSVTFPEAGTYDLYVRVRVGSSGANDDSFFYGNGFGTKSATSDADWIFCNNLADSRGFTSPTDVVTGAGTAGNQVWKWLNISEFNGGETPITFTVTAGNLTQTFQIGGREDGLWIDALLFGTATYTFTVADLDAGNGGNPPSPPPSSPTNGTCTINWTDVRQQIDGFGGGVQFLNPTSLDPVPNSVMDTLFGTANTNQLGLSILRIGIDPNGNWNNQMLDAQKAVARGASILATPWSPPASMKDNGSTIHGSLLPAQYTNYANYLNGYAAFMRSNSAPLRAISIQNEPDWDASYDGCLWTAAQFQTFVHDVGGLITNAPVMMPESLNYNQSMSDLTLNDSVAAANVDLVGGHLYGNGDAGATVADYPNAHNKGKPTWMTEFLVNDQTIGTAIITARQVHECLTTGNMSAYIWWKAQGDANGLVNASGVPQRRGFVLAQWSRFVHTNYFRIGVSKQTNSLASAYKDPNGTGFAIVAINTNASLIITQTFNLTNFATVTNVTPWITSATSSLGVQPAVTVSNAAFTYILPVQSIITFVGQSVSNAPNAAPTNISMSNSSVSENQTANTVVGTLSTSDPDSGNTFTYTLVSGIGSVDNGWFNISGSSLRTSASFDYEIQSSYSIRVRSTDQGSLFFEKAFTITVTDTNESPTLETVADGTIDAGVTLMITNGATDPEVPSQTLTFSMLSTDPTNATLDANSGIFTWRPLVSQADTTNLITVKVTDDGVPNLSDTNSYTIIVNPLTPATLNSISTAGGQVSLTVTGPSGPDYTLWTSTNLFDWQALFTTNSPALPTTLVDTNLNEPERFYRIGLGP